jgi:hypothetical protein
MMGLMKFKKILFFFFIFACIFLGINLLLSVFKSGYWYQFDVDELLYSQYVYLYSHGFKPYLDIYASVYTPVFFWISAPIFLVKGFTFEGIYAARTVMIVLLCIRLFSAFLLFKTVFNKRVAFLFIPLFLFDPFAVFTTMQFRPDNLMLTLLTLGLLFFSLGVTQKKQVYIAVSGLTLGFAVVILSKIIPTLIVITGIFAWYCIEKKRIKDFVLFACYGSIVPVLFILFTLSQGMFAQMIQQMFRDIKLLYTNFKYPIPLNALLHPDNIYVFGTMGKPLTWAYAWLIAPLGIAGLYHALSDIIRRKSTEQRDIIKIMLVFSLLSQWAVLFFVQVAFMQHYMPVNWLMAVFGAYALDELLTVSEKHPVARLATPIIIIICIGALTLKSTRYNEARSTIKGLDTQAAYEARWKQIPPDEAVFPSYLFRPAMYPIAYGGFIVNFPEVILNRFPNIPILLEQKKPRLLLDQYTLDRLPANAIIFISEHYVRVPQDNELMVWSK